MSIPTFVIVATSPAGETRSETTSSPKVALELARKLREDGYLNVLIYQDEELVEDLELLRDLFDRTEKR